MKRIKTIKATLILVLLANSLSAQNPLVKQWDKRYGAKKNEWLSLIKQTHDGGFILGGSSHSGHTGDKSEPSRGGWDYWIIKIDPIGNKQWDKRFGGIDNDYLVSLRQTKDEGYILGGYSYSDSSGDKSQPNWDTTLNSEDYWVIKIDSVGNKQWDKRFGGTDWDWFGDVEQAQDGGFMIGGWSASGISGDKTQANWGGADMWVVKTDSLGNKLWDRRYGGVEGGEKLNSLLLTKDGGFILGGLSGSGISGDKSEPSQGYTDYWMIKIDSLGNKQWDKRFGGTYDDFFSSLNLTDDGYILGGISQSDAGGDKTYPLWGGFLDKDYWVIRTDSLGNKIWDKDYGGTYYEFTFGNLSQTYDKGFLIAGASSSNIGGNKTEDNLGGEQSWIVKTDSAGNVEWDKTIFTTEYDWVGYAIQTKDSCFMIANYTQAGIGGYKTQPNWDTATYTRDYWIVKFCDSIVTTSKNQISNSKLPLSIFPNPFSDELNITTETNEPVEITLFDVTARKIFTQSFTNTTSINTEQLAKGLYLYEVRNKNGPDRYREIKKGKIIKD